MRKLFHFNHLLKVAIIISFSLTISAQTDFWEPKNNGITSPNINIKELAVNSTDDLFAAVMLHGVFVTTDGGETWNQKNSGLTNLELLSICVAPSDNLFVGTTNGMFKSTNKGDTWEKIEIDSYFSRFAKIIASPNGYLFAAGTFEGMFRSLDNGANWEKINNGLLGSGDITSLFADLHGQILAGTTFGRIYFTNSYGDGWTESSVGLPRVTTAPVLSIVENVDEKYFLGTGQGVYRSTDYGLNWSQVHSGGGNGYVHSLLVDHSDNVYIGTGNSGVYMSSNNGEDWQQINSGLTHPGVYSMVINSSGYIFITTGDGIFKSTRSVVTVEEENIQSEFSLEQNYPNPFNPTTIISYTVSKKCNVNIKIYDLLGKEIIQLIDMEQLAGSYKISFNAENLSSGVYLYKIIAGSFVDSKKMLLIR